MPINEGDEYPNFCDTEEEFMKVVREMGFDGISDFIEDTGVYFSDVKGKKWTLVHNRVFTEDISK